MYCTAFSQYSHCVTIVGTVLVFHPVYCTIISRLPLLFIYADTKSNDRFARKLCTAMEFRWMLYVILASKTLCRLLETMKILSCSSWCVRAQARYSCLLVDCFVFVCVSRELCRLVPGCCEDFSCRGHPGLWQHLGMRL